MTEVNVQVDEGRLFRLRLERSSASRQDALATIRRTVGCLWTVRIGGAVRGTWRRFQSKAACEAAVKAHYDAALLAAVRGRRKA